jgi:4-amino-4-deoxy-L-arabinose transferase-like glycosyltransferase
MRTSALQYLYLQKPISTIIIICAIVLLPWLSSDFYTKGEPREASVAVSMIESGNWILPKVYAEEFAYKPPLDHWLTAAFSLPGGHVTEFASRLPSALAQIILIGFVLAFFGKRIRFHEAFIATFLLVTCFEIHRAGMTARVDMLLTTFIVIGLMQLYRWENKLELKGLPVLIPFLFSCAVLTKGPVGIIMPLFVFFVYLLILNKYSFLKILKSLLYVGISSMFLPLLWYVAAYRQGGDEFLSVVLAENFGRFFHLSESSISYDLGHKEGIFYNFITLLSGFLPWSLLLFFSLFGTKWSFKKKSVKEILSDALKVIRSMDKMKLFSLVAAVCIIFFYTIPSSKRSVYIMPAYPFIAIFLSQYFLNLSESRAKVTRIFAYVLTTITAIVFIAATLIITDIFDLTELVSRFTTKESTLHEVNNIAIAMDTSSWWSIWFIMTLFLISLITTIYHLTKRINIKILYSTILLTFCLNLFIDAIVMKEIKNNRSARPFAETIKKEHNITKENVYVMNNLREYMNLYAMNFYMGNTFRDFEAYNPDKGYFLTTEKDVKKVMEQFGTTYNFKLLNASEYQGDIRSKALLFEFSKSRIN